MMPGAGRARGAGWRLRDAWRRATHGSAGRSADGPIIVCLLAMLVGPYALGAQPRERRTYSTSAPEAKLMLYYSSTVAFSPLGIPLGADKPAARMVGTRRASAWVEAAVEVSYLPPLSASQRTAGSDKAEATNLAPVFARPRIGVRLPAGLGLELSWIPPVRLFDVKANLLAGAVSRAIALPSRVRLVPRVAVLGGRVEGPITCNRDTARGAGASLATYYALVCYGNNSRDFFEPRQLSGELLVARSSTSGRWQPYASAGARYERTRFDVGVIRRDGTRDRDQPVIGVNATRPYVAAGTSWLAPRNARLAAELYYAPGSVVTMRALAGVRLW